jgi:TonB family protein
MLIATMLAAAATSAVPLPASGPWMVRAEQSVCLLERTYKVGKDEITLWFQPLLDTGTMDLYVITNDRAHQQHVGLAEAFAADQVRYKGRYISIYAPKLKRRLTRVSIDRALLDQFRPGDALRVVAKPIDLSFVIPSPDKARNALQACVDNLERAWGIDAASAARAVGPVDGSPAKYFSSSSYPSAALRKGIFGRVIALLNIDAQGSVTHCRVLSSAGPELNEGTCKAAQVIKFKPPVDKSGAPLPSVYVLPVRWVLPGAPESF